MKMLILILALLPLLGGSAYAESLSETVGKLSGVTGLESKLPEDVKKISGKIDDSGIYDVGGALKRLADNAIVHIKENLNENIKEFFSLILISLLCAFSCTLCKDKITADYINIAGVSAVASVFIGNVDGMVSEVVEALNQINSYSKAAFPAVFTAAAAGGALVGSSARYAAVCLGLDIIMNTAEKLIIPLVYSFLALALCKGLVDNPLIRTVQHFIKWLAGITMTAVTLVFSTYISISGTISSCADAMAVKTARTVIANFLPVVGGMISDAASTVLSAANMIKSSAGAVSLIAVCAICSAPFIKLSLKMIIMRLAASACDMVPCGRVSGFINDIAVALSFLMGLLGCVSIMLFISFMSVIKVVAG